MESIFADEPSHVLHKRNIHSFSSITNRLCNVFLCKYFELYPAVLQRVSFVQTQCYSTVSFFINFKFS